LAKNEAEINPVLKTHSLSPSWQEMKIREIYKAARERVSGAIIFCPFLQQGYSWAGNAKQLRGGGRRPHRPRHLPLQVLLITKELIR